MNSSTTFNILSSNTSVFDFTPPRQLTIANNAQFVTGTATTLGAGNAQIVAQASPTGIDQGASSAINVAPVVTSAYNAGTTTNANGPANQTTAIELIGRNLLNVSGITAPNGIVATITGFTSTKLNVNVQVPAGVPAGAKTLTVTSSTGNVNFTFTVN
jgi:hypothetical protein